MWCVCRTYERWTKEMKVAVRRKRRSRYNTPHTKWSIKVYFYRFYCSICVWRTHFLIAFHTRTRTKWNEMHIRQCPSEWTKLHYRRLNEQWTIAEGLRPRHRRRHPFESIFHFWNHLCALSSRCICLCVSFIAIRAEIQIVRECSVRMHSQMSHGANRRGFSGNGELPCPTMIMSWCIAPNVVNVRIDFIGGFGSTWFGSCEMWYRPYEHNWSVSNWTCILCRSKGACVHHAPYSVCDSAPLICHSIYWIRIDPNLN